MKKENSSIYDRMNMIELDRTINKGGIDMKKVLVSAVMITMFAVPAICGQSSEYKAQQKAKVQEHKTAQKAENQQFRGTLKGMTKEQKAEAKMQQRATQHQENMAFKKDMYTQNRSYLEQKLVGNKKLTQAQKDELFKLYDSNHNARAEYREGQYKENSDYVSKIANDTSMTQEQRKAAIKAHFEQQRAENAKYREEMKANTKETKGTIKTNTEQ